MDVPYAEIALLNKLYGQILNPKDFVALSAAQKSQQVFKKADNDFSNSNFIFAVYSRHVSIHREFFSMMNSK